MHAGVLLSRLGNLCLNLSVILHYRDTQPCTEVSATNYASTSVTSRPECAEICSADANCKSFSFCELNTTCYLNQEFLPDTGTACPTNGFVHFNLETQLYMFECLNGAVYDAPTNTCQCVNGYIGERCERLMIDCTEGLNYYPNKEEAFNIQPSSSTKPFRVRCSNKHDGRTVVLRQAYYNQDVNFTRGWEDYKNGFGDLEGNGDFYIGNEAIHHLTNGRSQVLYIEAIFTKPTDPVMDYRQYSYSLITIGDESENYRLTYDYKYTSDTIDDCFPVKNIEFSTIDRDNDADPGSCAQTHMSGWWFNACGPCNPTGQVQDESETYQTGAPTSLNIPVSDNLAVRYLNVFLVSE